MAHLSQDETILDLPLTIFETTRDTSQVSVDRLHILFDFPSEGVVRVVEMWVLSNRSDRMLVAQDSGAVLKVTIPQGATDLHFEQGVEDRFLLTEGGFAYTMPLIPGMDIERLVFSFDLPYDRRLAFKQTVSYPVEAVVVLLPENGIKVQGDGLQDQGDLGAMEGLHSYTSGPLSSGDTLTLNLSGRPPSAGGEAPLSNVFIGASALGVALIAASLWWYQARGGGGILTRVRGEPSDEGISDSQVLLRAIATLDDDFEDGEIPEDKYHRRREALKQQALYSMRRDDD